MSPALIAVAAMHAARLVAHYGDGKPGGRPLGRGPQGPIGGWGVFVLVALMPTGLVAIAVAPFAAPVVSLALVLLAFPWPFARLVLVPFGLARIAYWITRGSDITFRLDPKGGAAVAAAWALCMQRKPDEATAEWLSNKIAEEAPLRGAGLLASGLLLAARGDREGARLLVGSVLDVHESACPPAARRTAPGGLTAAAAARGDGAGVAVVGNTLGRGGRLGWLLSAIAQSLLLEPMSPGKLGLWIRWAVAPHRRATLPMVERAVAALDGAFIEPEEEPPIAPAQSAAGGDAIHAALSLHAAVLTRPKAALRPEDVRAAGQAWDAALQGRATERMLLERALVVGASGASAVLARMRATVEDDLTGVVLASGMALKDLDGGGEVTSSVRARLRDRLLTEIETASEAIKRRYDERRALPGPDEWREWGNLCALYERGVRSAGDDLRRLAFVKVFGDTCNYGVWLYNDQKQRPLANAIFRWLLAQAVAVGDARAETLMNKNVSCGV